MDRKDLEAKVLQAVACVMPEIDISNIEFQDSELALGLYYDMNDVVAAVAAKLN